MASSFDNLVLRIRVELPSEHSREDLVRMYMPYAVDDYGLPTDWPTLVPENDHAPIYLCSWLADTAGYLYLCVRQITALYEEFRPEPQPSPGTAGQWLDAEKVRLNAARQVAALQKAIIAEWNLHNRLLKLLEPHMAPGAVAAEPTEIVPIDEVPPPLPEDGDADDHPGLTESIRKMAQKYRPALEAKEQAPAGEDLKKAIERAVGPE